MKSSDFDKQSFWSKIKTCCRRMGIRTVYQAFTLYYCLVDADTPMWVKTTIAGALAYLINPIDAIPDLIAFVGYTDDMSVLAMALATVSAHIKVEHKERAIKQVEILFGESPGFDHAI